MQVTEKKESGSAVLQIMVDIASFFSSVGSRKQLRRFAASLDLRADDEGSVAEALRSFPGREDRGKLFEELDRLTGCDKDSSKFMKKLRQNLVLRGHCARQTVTRDGVEHPVADATDTLGRDAAFHTTTSRASYK